MMSDLDSILNGTDTAEEPAPEVVETPAEEPAGEAQPKPADGGDLPAAGSRDERGRFVSTGDREPAPAGEPAPGAAPAPKVEDLPLDHPALLGERRRRQDAERQLDELKARLNPQPEAPARQPAPTVATAPPDRFEDPEGYDAWLIQNVSQRARAEAVAAMQEERIALSADKARAKYEDWTEAAGVFAKLAEANPALERALRTHPDPAEYAYSTAKLHLDLQQHGGSIEALIAAREEAARAAVRAELEAAREPAPTAETPIPESLAGSQSARSSTAAAPGGPPSLAEILNPPRK